MPRKRLKIIRVGVAHLPFSVSELFNCWRGWRAVLGDSVRKNVIDFTGKVFVKYLVSLFSFAQDSNCVVNFMYVIVCSRYLFHSLASGIQVGKRFGVGISEMVKTLVGDESFGTINRYKYKLLLNIFTFDNNNSLELARITLLRLVLFYTPLPSLRYLLLIMLELVDTLCNTFCCPERFR